MDDDFGEFNISAEEVERMLCEGIIAMSDFDDLSDESVDLSSGIENVVTYSDTGVMTMDRGLVLRFADGSEFQLTIVRSK